MTVHQLGMMTDLELDGEFRRLSEQWHVAGSTRRMILRPILDSVLDERVRRAEAARSTA